MFSEYEKFLYDNYKGEINNLLNDHSESVHASITVSLNTLKIQNAKLYREVINDIHKIEREWDIALLNIQNKIAQEDCFLDSDYTIKENCHVRFTNLPINEDILCGIFPDNECIGLFVQVKGNVIQMSQEKLLEIKREMVCSKCNSTFIFEAQYGKMYKFDIPERCLNIGNCKGILRLKNNLPKPEYCMDFQQIKIQEFVSTDCGNYPTSLIICLENDLVNSCKPGECVTICGVVEARWRSLNVGSRGLHVLSLRANSIVKENNKPNNICKDFDEQMFCAQAQWQENVDSLGLIKARNLLVDSICPEIIGMSYIKLGLALALSSGFHAKRKKINEKRDQSHILLVGDSGSGKSKMLNAICQITPGAIHTNGLGCSVAGLTAAAFKDGNDWNLQAGALVLADGGLCCIDQFNLMHQHDKAAVHETMEQQTISIAKAGLVCKLQTQCIILASANFKSSTRQTTEKFLPSNLDIGGPLLSRFDLIFAVNDDREIEMDLQITDHLLKLTKNACEARYLQLLSQQRLQSHFAAIREINPKFHNLAHIVLGSYYKYYRSNFERDLSRTTVRMLDSINRLAQSHARLMFRNEVLAFDAIIVIELLEATWGFGKIIKPPHFTKKSEQLLIDDSTISIILDALDLSDIKMNIIEEKQKIFGYNIEVNNFQTKTDLEYVSRNDAQQNSQSILSADEECREFLVDDRRNVTKEFNITNREYFHQHIENTNLRKNIFSKEANALEETHNILISNKTENEQSLCKSRKFLNKNGTKKLPSHFIDDYFDDGFENILSQGKFVGLPHKMVEESRTSLHKENTKKGCNKPDYHSDFENIFRSTSSKQKLQMNSTPQKLNTKSIILENDYNSKKNFVEKSSEELLSNSNLNRSSKSIKLIGENEGTTGFLLESTNVSVGGKSTNQVKKFWNFAQNSDSGYKFINNNFKKFNSPLSNTNANKRPHLFDDNEINFNLDLPELKKIKTTTRYDDKKNQNEIESVKNNKIRKNQNNEQGSIPGFTECLSKTDNLDFLELNF